MFMIFKLRFGFKNLVTKRAREHIQFLVLPVLPVIQTERTLGILRLSLNLYTYPYHRHWLLL